jgi:UrcA family protein
MTTSLKLLSTLAVAAAVSLLALPTDAAEPVRPDNTRSRTVKTWDLDLAKSEDVQELYARVRAAANEVCQEEVRRYRSSTRRPAPAGWAARCVNDAVEGAVRDVGNRRLATLHLNGAQALL